MGLPVRRAGTTLPGYRLLLSCPWSRSGQRCDDLAVHLSIQAAWVVGPGVGSYALCRLRKNTASVRQGFNFRDGEAFALCLKQNKQYVCICQTNCLLYV